MKKTKISIFIFTLLFLFPSIYNGSFVTGQLVHSGTTSDTPIIDNIRDLKIEFEPPNLLLDCGSLFFLNVTITKTKFTHLPRIFSITVFLDIKDEFDKSKIIQIGSQPLVYMPHYQQEKTINISCFTTNNLIENLYCLYSGEKTEINIDKSGAIGVRIDKKPRWICNGIMSKFQWVINEAMLLKPWEWLLRRDFPTARYPSNIVRIISILQMVNSCLIGMNRFIVWEDVKLTSPFACSEDICFEYDYMSIDEKTDKEGNFNVTVYIKNDLDEEIEVFVLVDISNKPLFNSLLPSFKEKMYNVGFNNTSISGNSYYQTNISCSFPINGFFKKNYSVTIECLPYIPIEGKNQFGFLFYDLRWKIFTEPKYWVKGSVKNSIKEFWYNLPILNGNPEKTAILPNYHGEISYNGPVTEEELVVQAIDQIGEEVKGWIYIYFFLTLLLIGFFIIGYWYVKKYS